MRRTLIFFIALAFCAINAHAERPSPNSVKRGGKIMNIADRHFSAPLYRSKAGAPINPLLFNPRIKYINSVWNNQKIFPKATRAPAGISVDEPKTTDPTPPAVAQTTDAPPDPDSAPRLIIALPAPRVEGSVSVPAAKPIRSPIATLPAPLNQSPEPAPPLAPPPPKVTKEVGAFSSLEASPTLYYSALKGHLLTNETHATVVSKLNAGLGVTWHQYWNRRFNTLFRFGVRQEKYASDPSFSSEVRGSSQTLTNLEAGLRWNQSEKFWIATEFGYSQELYYRGFYSGPGVELEAVNVPKLVVTVGARIFHVPPLHLDAKLSGIFTAGVATSNYFVKSGNGYRAEIEIGQEFRLLDAAASVFYEGRKQDSSIVDINRTDAGLSLLFRWRLSKP